MSEKPRQSAVFVLAMLLVLAFFLLSGACGLVYQVVWTRKLVLLFGSTSYAVSTVLSIFFLGLGLGAAWGGRLADRAKNPLALYGVFELIIGAWALVFLFLVTRGESWAVPLLQQLHGSRGMGIGVRAVLTALLLLPPCFLMGATLPLLAKFVNREPRVQGLKIGFLYTANTIGAAVGCYVAGFQLLPQLGYFQATLVAAALNVGVGVLSLALSLLYRPRGVDASADDEMFGAPMSPGHAKLVLAAFGVSGFVALALEVLWTRLLVIGFLGTTYAYTTMLTVLLSGLVVGGAVGSLVVRSGRARIAWLGGTMAFCAVACLYLMVRIAAVPAGLQDYGNDWKQMTQATFTLSAIALFPSAFLFGVAFPIAVTLLGRARETLGRDLGVIYAVNTICGMLGAIAGGYIIIPLFGTHAGILVLAVLLLATGLVVLLSCPVSGGRLKGTLAGSAVVLFGVAYALAPADVMQALNTGYVPEADHIIHFAEHTEGTVAVSAPKENDTGSDRVLWINRVQATASIVKGVKMNRFQGVLPLLFDRDPQNVLFMCFGSGITCGTLALSDFAKIDAVEINPGVLEAAPLFARDNLDVLDRPNVHTHIDDGRNFLLTSTEKYDLITFEPMPLALAGVSTFYTEEYYRLCRERLSPGGLVSQWIPLHSLTPDIVKGLTATFLSVFPHCTAWFVNADVFLIGSDEPLLLDFDAARERMSSPELAEALAAVGFKDPYEVFASFLMSDASLRDWAEGGTPLSDDLPWAEFEAPKMVYAAKVPDSVATIEPHIISPGAYFKPGTISDEDLALVERRHLAHRNDFAALKPYYSGFAIDTAASSAFMRSLEIDPNDYNAQGYLKQLIGKQAEAFLQWEEFDKLEAVLSQAIVFMPDDLDLQLAWGDLYHAKGEVERARAEYKRYRDMGGSESRALQRASE